MPDGCNHRRLALTFSREVTGELAFDGHLSHALSAAIRESGFRLPPPRPTYADLFDRVYDELARCYRCAYVYKNELARSLLLETHGVGRATLLAEVRVKNCLADIAIISDTSTAYEIKSELDSPVRLGRQLEAYRSLFARLFVVTHESQLTKLARATGDDVGLMILTDDLKLETVREAIADSGRVDPAAAMSCLRQPEYIWAVAQAYGESPRVPNTHVYTACRELFVRLAPERAHELMVAALRRRAHAETLGPFVQKLPRSLKVLGLTQPLSGRKRRLLLEALDRPYKDARKSLAQRSRQLSPPRIGPDDLPPIPF